MNSFVNLVSGLASPWLYIVVAALAAAESAALVGLVVPGEIALLTGGFAASQGRVNLPIMIVTATVAAIAGTRRAMRSAGTSAPECEPVVLARGSANLVGPGQRTSSNAVGARRFCLGDRLASCGRWCPVSPA